MRPYSRLRRFLVLTTGCRSISFASIRQLGEPDYLIVYECGFILRLYHVPPDERYEFSGSGRGRADLERLLRRAGQTTKLPETVRADLAQHLVDDLLTQLRSYPIGMRIDKWIHETFPALDGLQRDCGHAAATRQPLRAPTRNPRACAQTGPRSQCLDECAYAIFCDRVFGKAGYAIPYRSAGYEKRGRALLEIMESIPEDPAYLIAHSLMRGAKNSVSSTGTSGLRCSRRQDLPQRRARYY